MLKVRLSKRRFKKYFRYAIQGVGLGLIASLAVIPGTIVIVRLSIGRPIGHRVPLSCVLFTTIFLLIFDRLGRKPEATRGSEPALRDRARYHRRDGGQMLVVADRERAARKNSTGR